MNIECFNFAKEPNSTSQPSGSGRVVSCVLKDDCSIMHPVFLLSSWSMTDNYIKWNSRFYWIEDIVIITNDHAEYHCREDVLATFKSYIGSSSQYILRSAHAYNGSLIDTKYPALTSIVRSESTFNGNIGSSITGNGFFVLGLMNGSTVSSGGITYYALGETQMQNLLQFMYGGTWLDTSGATINTALQKELVNPMQYISSIVWFPFSTDIYGSYPVENPVFGWWTATGVLGSRIDAGSFVQVFSETIQLPRHPQASNKGTYLNCEPFTRHTLFFYGFGQIPLDASQFAESNNAVFTLSVDLSTGDAKLTISDNSPKVLQQMYGKMGAPVQISQLSQSLTSPLTNVISGAVGLAYGNVVGFGQGILSGIESMMPQCERSGATGSRMAYLKKPTILTECRQIASEDNAHLGRPLCMRGTISSYPGYNVVENADINFACNYSELTEIKSFMESGFYYE